MNRISCTIIAEISNSLIKASVYSPKNFFKEVRFERNILENKTIDRATGSFKLDGIKYIISSPASEHRSHLKLVNLDKDEFLRRVICAIFANSLDVIDLEEKYDVNLYLIVLENRVLTDVQSDFDKFNPKIANKTFDIKIIVKHITREGEMGCLLLEDKYTCIKKTYSLDGEYGIMCLVTAERTKGNDLNRRSIEDHKIYRIGATDLIDYIKDNTKKKYCIL